MNVASAESGIDKNTATVARKLPRNSRIISEVSSSPSAPSWSSVLIAFLTNMRLIEDDVRLEVLGHVEQFATSRCTPSTTAIVLVSPPCLSTGR